VKLAVLALGKLREEYARLAAGMYARRISKLASFELIEIAEPRGGETSRLREDILSRKKPGDRLVLLASGGRLRTTEDFASMISHALSGGRGRLVFVVGGPYGVGPEVEALADEKLSLGPMTLPHELARVVLLEQIYRALTIVKGLPYHHG
jgi:23S rRNA (pseudouridine1915-N3)-methyltransferase